MRSERWDTQEPIRLSLEVPSGDVRVETGDEPETTVDLEPAHDDDASVEAVEKARIELRGGELSVIVPEQRTFGISFGRRGAVILRVRTPHGATVSIESIHAHLASGLSRARGVIEASRKTAVPRFLAMLSVLAVFIPSFFMTGVGRQLFVPLSLAVGFAMLASYLLSSTLVPVLSTWLLRSAAAKEPGFFEKARAKYRDRLERSLGLGWVLVAAYLLVAVVMGTYLSAASRASRRAMLSALFARSVSRRTS